MSLLAIDPSLTCTGWAWFDDGDVVESGYIVGKGETWPDKCWDILRKFDSVCPFSPDDLVIEYPQIYNWRGKGDPNNIMKIAYLCGLFSGFTKPRLVTPKEWKKQLKKPTVWRKVAEITGETSPKSEKSRDGDRWDAIALGYWYLGKLVLT